MRRVYVRAPKLSSRLDLDRRQKLVRSATVARPPGIDTVNPLNREMW
jgi:hypothetical protein